MLSLFNKNAIESIDVNDMDTLIGQVEIIDIREQYEFKNGSLKTAKNIPMSTLLSEPQKYLSKELTYYIICHSGGRSLATCKMLIKQGYNVINVSGGFSSYFGTLIQ